MKKALTEIRKDGGGDGWSGCVVLTILQLCKKEEDAKANITQRNITIIIIFPMNYLRYTLQPQSTPPPS
ncbi:unnamed protein product [Gongylonema pulchrum]|uniref:Uncharacterized protein n=1 Tax=Gongylonema pulchrum TaxID=637853 RepID=A0A183F0I0_9BILA|nr:unnamed protein product [Gongylonema pulchrum]